MLNNVLKGLSPLGGIRQAIPYTTLTVDNEVITVDNEDVSVDADEYRISGETTETK